MAKKNYVQDIYSSKSSNSNNKTKSNSGLIGSALVGAQRGASSVLKNNSTKSGKRNYAQEISTGKEVNRLSLETLASDVTSLNERLQSAYGGWQSRDTMNSTRSALQSMYDRLEKYQSLRGTFGGADLSELKNNYKSILDEWDDLSNNYAKYNTVYGYNHEMAKLDELYAMTTKDIKPFLNDKKNTVAYTTADGYNIKWEDLYNDAYLREYEQNAKDTIDIEKYGGFKKKDVKYSRGLFDTFSVASDEDAHIYNLINADDEAKKQESAYNTYVVDTDDAMRFNHLTEDEKKLFNAIWVTQGKEKALEYADLLSSDLRQRRVNWQREQDIKNAKEDPVGASVISVFHNLANNMVALPLMGADLVEDGSIDANSPLYRGRNKVKTERSAVEGMIDNDVGQFFYRHGMNAADNVAAMAAGGFGKFGTLSKVVQTGIQSSGAFVDTTIDAKTRGLSDEQALTLGTIAGASEAYFESKSFESFFNSKNLTRSGTKYFLDNLKTEMIGELGTELTNDVADFLVAQDLSKWNTDIRKYVAQGMTENEALSKVITESALKYADVAAGTIFSTGVMSGPTAAIGSYNQRAFNTEMGQNVRANNRVSEIFDLSANPEMASAYEVYTQYAKKGVNTDNVTDTQLGRLYTNAKLDAQDVLDANAKAQKSKKVSKNAPTEAQVKSAEKTIADLDIYAQSKPSAEVEKSSKDISKDTESVVALIQSGLESAEGTESHTIATELKSKIKNYDKLSEIVTKKMNDETLTADEVKLLEESKTKISSKEVSNLLKANDMAMNEEVSETVTARMTEIEGSKEMADIVTRKLNGERITTAEAEKLNASEQGLQVLAENGHEQLVGYAEKMESKEDANLFMALYDGKSDVDAYANAFNLVSSYAEKGYTIDTVFENKSVLTYSQAKEIYKKKRIDVDRQKKAEIEKVNEGMGSALTYKGFIDDSAIIYDTPSADASGGAIGNLNGENSVAMSGFSVGTTEGTTTRDAEEVSNGDLKGASAKNSKGKKGSKKSSNGKKTEATSEKEPANERDSNKGSLSTNGKRIRWSKLKPRQRMAITFAKGLAKASGMNLVLEADADYNGKLVVKNNTIYLDINAGIDHVTTFDDTIIPTFSHEITHWMKRKVPELWNKMNELVFSTLKSADGLSETERIALKIAELEEERGNGKKVSEEEAREEIIASACEDMLKQSKEGKRLFNSLSETEQKTLVDKVKELIQKFKDWVSELLSLYDSGSYEAEIMRKFEDKYNEMSKLWDEMLRESVRVNQGLEQSGAYVHDASSIGSRDMADFSDALNTEGEVLFQYKAMVEDEAIYRNMLKKHQKTIGITDKQINDLFTTIDKAVDIISENLEALDYAWDTDINDRAFSPVKPNSDSLYKVSLDFSTLCRKRLLQQTIQTTLQESLNKQLSKAEAIAIRDELMKIQEEGRKIEIACALCYVESARMKSPVQINKFLNNREAIIKEFFANRSGGSIKEKVYNAEMKAREQLKKDNPDGLVGKNGVILDALTAPKSKMLKADADFVRAKGKEAKASYKLTKHEQAELDAAMGMSVVEFTSAEGLENLAKNHPELFDAYTSFVRNATHSKGIENDTWWRAGDSNSIGDNLIAQMNEENGLRSQSWSDFQVIHLLDYVAATIELSTKGAKRQSYTKVPDYVKLLGNTGDMINMSVIPKRAFSGKLGYDDVEGMAYKVAVELREKYHKTAGIICIGMDDAQIRLLLEDITIDMVIPYHHSGMSKETRKLMHIPTWKTYQNAQGESKLSDADAIARANEYGVELKKDSNYQKKPKFSEWFDLDEARQIAKMENDNPSDAEAYKKYGEMYGGYKAMQNAANNYLKLCAERGLAPKFSSKDADFTQEANYWKLLIDRKMVDNVTGEIIEQTPIKPIFNEKHVLEILNDELARYPQVKADQEYATRKVTEKFLSGDMKVDDSTLEAIKKPIDNVAGVNILESAAEEKITINMSDEERYEILKDKKILLVKVDTKLYKKYLQQMPELLDEKLGKTEAKKLLRKIGDEFGIFKEYEREDFNIRFEFGKNNLNESVQKQKGNYDIYAQMLSCFSDVISNAVGIEIHNRNEEGYKPDLTLKNVYVLCSAFENDTDLIPVKLSVKEFSDKTNRLYIAVALESIKKDRVESMGVQDNLTHIRTSPVTISIKDIFKNVNIKDGDFLKYVPNQFLNAEQIEAKNKVLEIESEENESQEELFSSRRNVSVYDVLGETDRIVKEHEALKESYEKVKKRLKLEGKVTGGKIYDNDKILKIAGRLRHISRSDIDKVDLARSIRDTFSYMSQNPDLSWNEVFEMCHNLADVILAESKPMKMVDDYSKEILKTIKGTKISLSDAQKREASNVFGKNWNRSFFNRANITDSGVPIEAQWQEWASMYPQFFKDDISDGDMIVELNEIINTLQKTSEISEEINTEDNKRGLAYEIYEQYLNTSPIVTTADKYDKKLKDLKAEHEDTVSKIRAEYKERMDKQRLADDIHYGKKLAEKEKKAEKIEAQREADKKKAMELYNKLRERKDAEIATAKQRGREKLNEYRENAERKTVTQRIYANTSTLNKWLTKNSKDYHIHDAMKGPVIKLLQAIDFSSKRMLEGGMPTEKDISFAEAFGEVRSMLQDATNMVEGLEELYGHDLAEDIKRLSEATYKLIGDNEYIINAMSNEQLRSLDKLVQRIKKVVSDLNKFHTIHHNQGAVSLAEEFMEHGEKIGNLKKQHGKLGKYFEFRNRTPYYFFKDLGKVGMKLFESFQDGWDKLAFNAKRVIDFAEETYKSDEVKKWSKETKKFTVTQFDGSERTFEMSIAQIMSLHCVSKQEDAIRHLMSGGMTLKRIDKKGHVVADYENISLAFSDIQSIVSSLDERQKEVADKLQGFMNTECSAWGNEISMARFGTKMFGLSDYFPIKVSEATVPTDNTKDVDNSSLFRLLNMSFTKSRNDYAEQSIEIGDVFDIFAQHASDMAKYNALALPVLDFNKFYSIHGKDGMGKEYGVVQTLKTVFGDEANGYLRRFVRDINGSENVSRDVLGNTFFQNAKVASVAANLRVVLLQPTAYHKASAILDNKYLIKAKAYIKLEPIGMVKKLKKAIENAEKYCGIVTWKSLGYYDTDISKGITEKIKHAESLKDKVLEKAMKGAEIADRVTFGTLWVACEFETKATRKDLRVGSKEYYDTVSKRLREVIYATQVVDSTMTRSDMMRSSDKMDKYLTTFGSEPTIAYNMLLDMVTQYNRDKQEFGKKEAFKRNGKKIRKVVMSYVLTNAVAALVESGFDWLRDDEEEMDVAKFMQNYFKNFALDMSIGNKLPMVKEFYSILQGYSSSRMDTQWIEYLFKAYDNFSKILSGEGDWLKLIKTFSKSMSDLSGIPFYNIFRDAMAILDKVGLVE